MRKNKTVDTVGNLIKDPALLLSVVVIWIFLILFVVMPIMKILSITFTEGGHFNLSGFGEILKKRYTKISACNSILRDAAWGTVRSSSGVYNRKEKIFFTKTYGTGGYD